MKKEREKDRINNKNSCFDKCTSVSVVDPIFLIQRYVFDVSVCQSRKTLTKTDSRMKKKRKKKKTTTKKHTTINKYIRFVTSMFVMFHIPHEFTHPHERMWKGKGSESSKYDSDIIYLFHCFPFFSLCRFFSLTSLPHCRRQFNYTVITWTYIWWYTYHVVLRASQANKVPIHHDIE